MKFFGCFLILFLKILNVQSTHLKGTWNTDDFFLFLLKFGFQKTDLHDPYSSGYVYGNFTTDIDKFNKTAALVVVDYDNFYDYYKHSKLINNKEQACQNMFASFNFGDCGKDYLKNVNFIGEVPCPKNKLCKNAGDSSDTVRGSQFSYQIKDTQNPR